jgi:hypothetical protein
MAKKSNILKSGTAKLKKILETRPTHILMIPEETEFRPHWLLWWLSLLLIVLVIGLMLTKNPQSISWLSQYCRI